MADSKSKSVTTTAAATTGAVDSKSGAAADALPYDIKLASADGIPNVVVVGYGMAGKLFHAYLITRSKGLRLYGIVAAKPEVGTQIKSDYPNARVFTTLAAALSDASVDVIVIATPSGTHGAMAIQCLNAGKHVVVDKPFALNLKECDDMIVQKLISTQRLGSVKWIEMAYQKGKSNTAWKSESVASGGGRFFDLGAHMIDQAVTLYPNESVKQVYCRMMFEFPEPQSKVDSHAMAVIEFSNGATVTVDANSTTTIEKPRFYVVGSTATFQKHGFDPQEAAMFKGDIDASVEEEKFFGILQTVDKSKPQVSVPTEKGCWRQYYDNLALVMTGKASPLVSLASVRRAIAVIDAALESVKVGGSVKCNIQPLTAPTAVGAAK